MISVAGHRAELGDHVRGRCPAAARAVTGVRHAGLARRVGAVEIGLEHAVFHDDQRLCREALTVPPARAHAPRDVGLVGDGDHVGADLFAQLALHKRPAALDPFGVGAVGDAVEDRIRGERAEYDRHPPGLVLARAQELHRLFGRARADSLRLEVVENTRRSRNPRNCPRRPRAARSP